MQAFINSIYLATEGEGIFIGRPQLFIRFQGCAVGCLNCDSKETWSFDKRFSMPVDEVMEQIEKRSVKVKRASITGGDPLHPKNIPSVLEVIKRLKSRGYWVNLEASGNHIDKEIFHLVDFISFDVKTPSTGVTAHNVLEKMMEYKGKFQVKSVIESREDFDFVHSFYNKLKKERDVDFPWVLTPAYNPGEHWPDKRIKTIIALNEEAGGIFRVICQQHKIIHGPDKKEI